MALGNLFSICFTSINNLNQQEASIYTLNLTKKMPLSSVQQIILCLKIGNSSDLFYCLTQPHKGNIAHTTIMWLHWISENLWLTRGTNALVKRSLYKCKRPITSRHYKHRKTDTPMMETDERSYNIQWPSFLPSIFSTVHQNDANKHKEEKWLTSWESRFRSWIK